MKNKITELLNKNVTQDEYGNYILDAYPSDIENLVNELLEAINYTHCCEELLCIKEDVDGLTVGKYYIELYKDRTHTKVVDDYGIETMYFSDRFVKPPKQ